jgi:protein-disulfide isomerase
MEINKMRNLGMRTNNLLKFAAALLSGMILFTGIASAEISDEEFAKKFAKYLESEKGKAALGTAVESYFKAKQQNARKAQEERQAAELERQFKSPVKIPVGNSPVKGPADAKVTIIEFSDFQCPYCTKGKNTMEEVLKMYPKDVRVVFKNLPLPFHKQAEPAARAALAAGKQGKFWEMHDALFDNQRKLNPDFYNELAEKLGLNMDQFKKDYDSEELKKAVKEDAELAKEHGIRGTPGFFVNGVAVKGAYPASHFKTIIDRWLEKG